MGGIPYKEIKERVSARDAAERYDMEIKHGKALCIWHTDHTPSLSFKDSYCHCFSCEKGGSSIDVVMQLFGLDAKDAATKINEEFGLGLVMNEHSASNATAKPQQTATRDALLVLDSWSTKRWSALCDASRRAQAVLESFTDPDTAWDHPRFLAALKAVCAANMQLDYLQHLLKINDISALVSLYKEGRTQSNAKKPIRRR